MKLLRLFFQNLVVALLYFFVGRWAIYLSSIEGTNASTIWLSSGIALGSLVTVASIGRPWPVVLFTSLGDTLEPLIEGHIIRKTFRRHEDIDQFRDVMFLGKRQHLLVYPASRSKGLNFRKKSFFHFRKT
ncbi:MAG TPA: hypothetical protein DD435_01920 [Cyanobacteria bacterium UBA8530]|nr:hypothetical protein [Cyanobacteria bacterium UBA8530]